MIMNEDKIEEAANKYALNRIDDSYKSYSEHRQLSASTFSGEDVSESFVAGAKFALANQWHDAGDELPYQCPECFEKDEPNYTKDILCCSEEGVCYIDYMFKSRTSGEWKWSVNDLCTPKCWMPIPSFNIK